MLDRGTQQCVGDSGKVFNRPGDLMFTGIMLALGGFDAGQHVGWYNH